jgi:Xaa-Pro aminopeptidase
MAGAGIDCLLMQNCGQFLGGYVRWFTDVPASNSNPMTVIFPSDDAMTVVTSGGKPLAPTPPAWAVRGVRERISLPYFLTMRYTNTLDAEAVTAELRKRNTKRLGIVGKGSMSAVMHEYLEENLAASELIDATDLVDEIKAIKSPEEISLIERSIAMHDAAFAAVPALVRPGKREYEIMSALQHLLVDMGSEEQLIMMGSAPAGGAAGIKPAYFQNRTLQEGDQLTIMIEVNGPGGFYGEVGRTVCLGEPPRHLVDAWEVAKAAQLRTAERLKPGARPADLFRAHNEFLEGHGYPAEGRLYAHSQGYDLVERPAIHPDEPMVLKANMHIAVHPLASTEHAFGFCCDNYLIGEQGAVRLSKTPLELLVV